MTLGVKHRGILLLVNCQENCLGKEECFGLGMAKSFLIWTNPK